MLSIKYSQNLCYLVVLKVEISVAKGDGNRYTSSQYKKQYFSILLHLKHHMTM